MMETHLTTAKNDLFYESLIRSYVDGPRFVERPWLERRILDALDEPNCRFLLLTAEPGAGKSAFMAWLARKNPGWPRYFIRRDQRSPLSDASAHSFLLQIGFQIAAICPKAFRPHNTEIAISQRVGTSDGRVIGAEINKLVTSPFYHKVVQIQQQVEKSRGDVVGLKIGTFVSDPRQIPTADLQHMALIDPARALQNQRLIILIDALDELRYRPQGETLLDWLVQCSELPENVRILLTSREDERLLARFRGAHRRRLLEDVIPDHGQDVRNDLAEYASRLVTIPAVCGLLTTQEKRQQFIEDAVEKAKGNLGYLDALGRAVDQAIALNDDDLLARLLTLYELPDDLTRLYAHFLHLIHDRIQEQSVAVQDPRTGQRHYLPAWEGLYHPLLGVLSAAYEPLTSEQLASLSRADVETYWVDGALARLRQFLDEENNRFQFYHVTLPEFLTASNTRLRHPDCYVDSRHWHRNIAQYYVETCARNWSSCDTYGLDHVVEHTVAADMADDVLEQELDRIFTPSFRDAREKAAGWQSPYLEDVRRIANRDPQRAARLCLDVIENSFPNSYVFQMSLKLLAALYPETGFVGNRRSSRHRTINDTVEILSQDPLPPNAVVELSKLLDGAKNPRVKGIVALALGETGDQEVAPKLVHLLKTGSYQERWAAADALIVLNDRSAVPELVEWYGETREDGSDRERVIYVLGWMQVEEARKKGLQADGLASNRAKNVGRAVDLMWQLSPAEEDTRWLLERLRDIVESDPARPQALGPWKDEWLQKRLVRALHKLGVTEAAVGLKRLSAHVAARGGPKDAVKRVNLVEAIEDAVRDLDS